jgi:hypothetical protein
MIANNINGTIRVFNSIPKVFELKKNTMNYNKLNPSVHYADGFRELVNPILEVNQYKTNIYFDSDNDVFTYNVEAYVEEDINENRKIEEQNKYLQRIEEGKNRFSKLAADFRIDKIDGVITHEFHRLLEGILKPVRDEFVNGQFISSLETLESIGSSEITIEIYDNIHASISEAIEIYY